MTANTLPPAPPPAGILEAALYVRDLDEAAEFYGNILGLEEITRAENRHVFFRVGSTVLLIFNPEATVKGASKTQFPVPGHGAHGPGHLCFAATRAEIDAWRIRLSEAGYPIEADFDWPNGARSIYCRDPSGNSLEFAEPRLWA